METTRRRKLLEQNNGSRNNLSTKKVRKSKKTQNNTIQRQLICLITSASILIFFLILVSKKDYFLFIGTYMDSFPWILGHTAVDKIATHLGYSDPVYAVIIDAGSTGSRVLAFSFHKAYLDKRLILDKELFVEISPGLSSFANDPAKGAATINELLERAKNEIPEQYWNSTPVVLKATAGLRLLPSHKSEAILKEVKLVFDKCPFFTTDESVSIMDGSDEGIYSWFTVNFLYDRLSKGPDATVAALDLGGGSTQVTFAPTSQSTLSQKEYIHIVPGFKTNLSVYTHSYLGLGLMAARKAIFKQDYPKGTVNYTTECVNPIIINAPWTYGGKDYLISGVQTDIKYKTEPAQGFLVSDKTPVVKFDKCLKIIKNYVKQMVNIPSELSTKEINAFSYYFDRASEFGLIDPFEGGVVEVKAFMKAAVEACETPNTDQPFMCFDLTFISVLLKDGFGLKPDIKLKLYKKILGHELSWALGAAFNVLQN